MGEILKPCAVSSAKFGNACAAYKHPRSVREAAVWAIGRRRRRRRRCGVLLLRHLGHALDGRSLGSAPRPVDHFPRSQRARDLREGAQNAPPVDPASLPYVPQAFIAIEDRRFHNHLGVDFRRHDAWGAENLRRSSRKAANDYAAIGEEPLLTNERSWRRKAQEIMLAFWLESRFTKDEILALYLSRVYFGGPTASKRRRSAISIALPANPHCCNRR